VIFQTDYDEIELSKKSDMTSFQWRYCYYVIEKHHQTHKI